ncbi:hypothetical protein B0H66DRAFT_603650 [Apodospora peruviana]|uniref:RNA polymerase II degradation factor 1 n=1 Tax=Apodospora peruviana TaxID=516989 RepID=A0AAE0I694_9PEZI|nr:hypothetical protein B0H66DRAFT_603650 [Apodospora peruviana]
MSEVQSRPAASRGRGAGRGGRGGYATRGGVRAANRSSSATNGDSKHDTDSALPSLEDEGEIGQLKKQYGSKVGLIKEMFADWSDVDILFALRETDGDENLTVTRIAEGTISQWGEVSKPKKERARPKAKNDTFTTTTADSVPAGHPRTARGGRTGTEGGRGRGRATERGGRGGVRGKPAHTATNGTRTKETAQLSVPTEESSVWDTQKSADEKPTWGDDTLAPAAAEPAPSALAATSTPVATPSTQKTWASMLRATVVHKPAPKPKEAPTPKATEPVIEPLPPAEPVQDEPEAVESEEATPEPVEEQPSPPPVDIPVVVPEIALLPSKDQLTEVNLEQIPNSSHEIETETAVSEAADSWDPRAQPTSANATPLSASQQQHQAGRTPVSGFATTATKATDRSSTRTPNYPRRVLDQREAVRMPGNRDQVASTAVQFGAFSLNGPIDDDIDGDREEPETRPQPPEDSPVTHPRTSLPPAQPAPIPEAFPTQKPAATLPPTGPAAAVPPTAPSQPSVPTQGVFYPQLPSRFPDPHGSEYSQKTPIPAVAQPSGQNAQQFGRFGQTVPQEPASFPGSKPFDSYAQQQPSASATQNQYDSGFQSQVPAAQPQTQQPGGAYTSAPSDFSHYAADAQSRHAYNSYYNQNYAQQQQQGAQGQQEGLPSQPQRSFSGYNAPQQTDNLSQYPQTAAQHTQSRFGAASGADAPIGGTPTPAQSATQAQTAQTSHGQSHSQQQPQEYPYNNHPYFNHPYYSAYIGGYGGAGYGQGGYGAPYGKGGAGYQPNQYGVSPQGPHGYSAPGAGFGQSALHRESSGGIGEYGRAASGQSGQQPGLGGSGFGGMHDTFGRGASSYQSQAGQSFNAPGSQPGSVPSAADDLKPFGDAKAPAGPSPSLGVAGARPGSAANNVPSQSGLPPPQSAQQSGLGMGGYSGYPSHLQQQQQAAHGLHGNQSAGGAGGYGMSASGGGAQGGHQNSYGGYGQFGGGSGYGSYGSNPPRGWGNNYH